MARSALLNVMVNAAIKAVRSLAPAKLVVAVPVAPAGARARLDPGIDEFVCGESPEDFDAVGRFYRDFGQTSDAEVRALLAPADPEKKD